MLASIPHHTTIDFCHLHSCQENFLPGTQASQNTNLSIYHNQPSVDILQISRNIITPSRPEPSGTPFTSSISRLVVLRQGRNRTVSSGSSSGRMSVSGLLVIPGPIHNTARILSGQCIFLERIPSEIITLCHSLSDIIYS